MAGRRLVATGVLGTAAVAAVAVTLLSGGGAGEPTAASQATDKTTIRRQDLVERDSVDGTLGYSDARAVINRLAGTVTWTPRVGSVVRTNRRLYEVDGAAVYLFDGSSPAYRTLKPGLRGDDVRQFERNMRRLGFDSVGAMSVDGTWDAGTTAAARRWQRSKGLAQDGTIDKGRIVFQPGSRRVSDVELAAGSSAAGGGGGGSNSPAAYDGAGGARTTLLVSAAGDQPEGDRFSDIPPRTTPAPATTAPAPAPATTTPAPATTTTTPAPAAPKKATPQARRQTTARPAANASAGATAAPTAGRDRAGGSGTGATAAADVSTQLMTTTSTRRIVAVDLETTKQALARTGADVVVELPDGSDVRGTIARVGKVAQKKSTSQNESPPATVKVVIKLRRATAAGGLDQAPVDVRLERRRARNALTVPVTALLARAGGEFAVELREAGRRRVVPVQTGIYTDSYVEIEGAGLRPGQTVTDSGL